MVEQSFISRRNKIIAGFSPDEAAGFNRVFDWLKENGVVDKAFGVGDRFPDFVLPDPDGALFDSRSGRATSLLVISFCHGEWCPFCNAELAALERVALEIQSLGGRILAIGPEVGDELRAMRRNLGLSKVTILADLDHCLGLVLGVIFTLPPALRFEFHTSGLHFVEHHEAPLTMLALPATYVVDHSGYIRDAYVQPDFTMRREPRDVVAALQRLQSSRRA